MSVRVYVPTTLRGLAAAVRDQEVGPLRGTAFAVTRELTRSAPGADTEELEYLAMVDAARASLRLIGAQGEDTPSLRVVIAADVDGEVREREDLDRSVVTLGAPIPWRAVAAVHLDGADAADAVAAAAAAVDAADLGDLDAEFVVGSAEDFELAWYAPGEIVYLLQELGLDPAN
ncbi:DUF6912 family protein [Nakamurella deserti]|uniref:DUF6912 family protein n=1 Tax=Nakamurella deserti TaxID=2164074 RepID=UPI0013009C1F|nr:hypothetical protein [Nakamurella deserti]